MGVRDFGAMPDGRPVCLVTLGRAPGLVLGLLDLGGTVQALEVTCGDGQRRNVVLGQGSVGDYLASDDYLGVTVGRYANRIAGGRFDLDGKTVQVGVQDRGNSLHGGPDGFHHRLWRLEDHSESEAHLSLDSPDGDEGFPGNLHVDLHVDVAGDTVRMRFEATTDAPTVVNLTNHTYFNLDGTGTGTVDEHWLTVLADEYTPIDDTGIPLGPHSPVADTPFDFRTPAPVGPASRSGDPQVVASGGIDHNFVVRGAGLRPAAVLSSPRTGTTLELHTDQPGLQVYTGNSLDGTRPAADGGRYRQGDGLALEPQLFPDTPHHPEWPTAVLRPGETYRALLEWRFGRALPGDPTGAV